MFLMIDNFDSFVYNLYLYFCELGQDVNVWRNDKITVEEICSMENLEGIIISPGPKSPKDCGESLNIVKSFAGKVPVLGVCLGHQIIGHAYGALIEKGKRPMHGKVSDIIHSGTGLFKGLEPVYPVTRYHSLVIREDTLPPEIQVDARTKDGTVMAISHRSFPVYGVQFHPEAVLTKYGHELLGNYVKLCREWNGMKVQKSEDDSKMSADKCCRG